MDLTYAASLTNDQKQAIIELLNHITNEEPFGPGVSSDWVKRDERSSTIVYSKGCRHSEV